MSAAAILLQAKGDGLELTATPAGTIKVRGPRAAVAAWTPIIVENKGALLAELSAAPSPDAARASVNRLLADMARENERRRDWYAQPVDGWREGRFTIRSVIDGSTTVIRFPKPNRRPS
jgi:hypothetical protein